MFLIILSPAKRLDIKKKINIKKETKPIFINESQELINNLQSLQKSDISSLMNLSQDLTDLNFNRYKGWDINHTLKNSSHAISCFQGDVYKELKVDDFSHDDLQYLQNHVRILSGLYGLLKPLDLIQPYRLEMGTKLKSAKGDNLYQFWGDKINMSIQNELKKRSCLINLSSNEYYKAVMHKKINKDIISPIFLDQKKGKYKVVSFFAKRARGAMTNYIIKNQVEDIDVLKKFNGLGYKFNFNKSTNTDLVFCR